MGLSGAVPRCGPARPETCVPWYSRPGVELLRSLRGSNRPHHRLPAGGPAGPGQIRLAPGSDQRLEGRELSPRDSAPQAEVFEPPLRATARALSCIPRATSARAGRGDLSRPSALDVANAAAPVAGPGQAALS